MGRFRRVRSTQCCCTAREAVVSADGRGTLEGEKKAVGIQPNGSSDWRGQQGRGGPHMQAHFEDRLKKCWWYEGGKSPKLYTTQHGRVCAPLNTRDCRKAAELQQPANHTLALGTGGGCGKVLASVDGPISRPVGDGAGRPVSRWKSVCAPEIPSTHVQNRTAEPAAALRGRAPPCACRNCMPMGGCRRDFGACIGGWHRCGRGGLHDSWRGRVIRRGPPCPSAPGRAAAPRWPPRSVRTRPSTGEAVPRRRVRPRALSTGASAARGPPPDGPSAARPHGGPWGSLPNCVWSVVPTVTAAIDSLCAAGGSGSGMADPIFLGAWCCARGGGGQWERPRVVGS